MYYCLGKQKKPAPNSRGKVLELELEFIPMTHQHALMLASGTMREIPGKLFAVVSPFSYYSTALLHPLITSPLLCTHTFKNMVMFCQE